MTDPQALAAAIADLEARRKILGDQVVEAAIAALQAQMAAPVAAPTAEARLRQVSILFADIADSTVLMQRLSADQALEVVSNALEVFAAAVRNAGGSVMRFTGDGLKAIFGADGVHEDEAERAVRAGLNIVEAAREHAARVRGSHGIEHFGVRVGVHTGPVALSRGQLAVAQQLATQAEQTARSVAHENSLAVAERQFGEIAHQRGDSAAALAHWDQALAEAATDSRPQWRVLSPQVLLSAIEGLQRAGDARAAELESALRQRCQEQLAHFDGGDHEARAALLTVPWIQALRPDSTQESSPPGASSAANP